jgi:hypothetical protein
MQFLKKFGISSTVSRLKSNPYQKLGGVIMLWIEEEM